MAKYVVVAEKRIPRGGLIEERPLGEFDASSDEMAIKLFIGCECDKSHSAENLLLFKLQEKNVRVIVEVFIKWKIWDQSG